MDTRRIAELLAPFLEKANDQRLTANDTLYEHISTYIDILLRWNARINLTAIRDPEETVTRHFGESLFAARHLFPITARLGTSNVETANVGTAAPGCPAEQRSASPVVADLGSGAGFPGLPLKLWAPHISLTLIESNHKKATFLREVIRALTLTDVDIQNVPAETLPPSSFDLVTLRAVERLPRVLPTAASLLSSAGRLELLVSSSQQATIHSTLPKMLWQQPIPIPLSSSRILLTGHRN